MMLLRLVTLALFAFLLQADDLTEELLAVTRKGDLAAVKSLLDRGADVNAKSPYGSTPLFFACDRGHIEIVKLLIERGADVNVEDTFYHATALTWATDKKRVEIIKLLLDRGAKSAAIVLMSGVQGGNAQIVKIALDKGGIDPKTLTSALGAATRANKTEIVEMLKAAGATPPEPVKTVQLDEATLANYAGTYTGSFRGADFEITFVVKNGNLSGTVLGQTALTYSPVTKTQFRSVEVDGISVEFVSDNGTVSGFRLTQGTVLIDFKRKAQSK